MHRSSHTRTTGNALPARRLNPSNTLKLVRFTILSSKENGQPNIGDHVLAPSKGIVGIKGNIRGANFVESKQRRDLIDRSRETVTDN